MISKEHLINEAVSSEDFIGTFSGTFDEIRKKLDQLEKEYTGKEYSNLQFVIEFVSYGPTEILLKGDRPETKEERKKREYLEECEFRKKIKAQEAKVARDRAQYEKLKAQFEKGLK